MVGARTRDSAPLVLIVCLRNPAPSSILPPVKRFLVPGLLLLASVLFAMWWFSEKQVVKRRTGALLDTVTIEPGGSKIGRGLQAASLDGFLAPNITLEVPDDEASGRMSRDTVSGGFRYVAEQVDFTRFTLEEVESISVNEEQAVVIARIDAKVVIGSQPRIQGAYRTEFTWKKIDGTWRITRVAMRPAKE